MKLRLPLLLLAVACPAAHSHVGSSDALLDRVSEQLAWSTSGGALRARLSGTLDLDAYAFDDPAPAFVYSDDSPLFQPRLTLFLDAQAGADFYAFAQARVDRGFDPTEAGLRGRLDEYAVRYTPFREGEIGIQAGQFATIAGQWVRRHLSWDNGFVSAPLFYEQPSGVSAYNPYQSSQNAAAQPSSGLPLVWGPSYATGVGVAGMLEHFEWAVELKNASLSSHPRYWTLNGQDFESPTVTARIAWRPDLRWTIGLSGSRGSYIAPLGDYDGYPLPELLRRGDYVQTVWLLDASYAHRHLQVWAELIHGSFEGPHLGVLRSSGYFVELRYKLSPRLSAATRWNQQFFSGVQDFQGSRERWGPQQGRLDVAITWRFTAHSQLRMELNQYTGADVRSSPTYAARWTLRF